MQSTWVPEPQGRAVPGGHRRLFLLLILGRSSAFFLIWQTSFLRKKGAYQVGLVSHAPVTAK